MDETLLTWHQALQLLALGPCIFMLFFLCVAGRHPAQIIVPALYFLGLSCSFLLPLRELLGLNDTFFAVLLMGASATPAISFLLIVQFMSGHPPKPLYWAILAVPLIGGSQLTYATIAIQGDVCIYEHFCTQPALLQKLYDIFSTSLTCLLTVFIYRRLSKKAAIGPIWEVREKHALVLALVALNLALLGIDLAQISGFGHLERAYLAKTVVRIGFIYLVLTFIFRMFDRPLDIVYERVPSLKPEEPNERDVQLAERIRTVFVQEKLHRDMELGREKLARKLGVSENVLSRVVNQCFHENVSMLVNQYRVEEAKMRLKNETIPITNIAFEVGFSSIPSFNRVFKQLTGISPSEYRATGVDEK